MNIQFSNVTCILEQREILKHVSITFDSQGIYTFIGKNGTGKSTFLSLLCGLIQPNTGNITADGIPIQENLAFRQSLAYLTNDMYTEVNDSLNSVIKRYQQFGKTNFQEKLFHTMIQDFKINPDTKLRTLSTGEKKIHLFIAHMVFNPTIIILDEYLDGVDVIHHKLFTKYLYQFCDTNQAKVFIVSHHAHDIYMLSDALFLIANQTIKPLGHVEDLLSKYEAMQVSCDETIISKLKAANVRVIHFEQFGKIATITYTVSQSADTFWQENQFQYCEPTTIPIERVIEYEFID